MKKKGKFILMYTILFVVMFCIAAIAVTFAWFSVKTSGSVNTSTSVTTGILDIDFTDSSVISIQTGVPIRDENALTDAYKNEFTLSHDVTSTLNACYSVSLKINKLDEKFQSEFFKWSLYDVSSSTMIANGDFEEAETGDEILLTNNNLLNLGNSKSYILRIWLSYSDDVDQSNMLIGNISSIFEGNIKVITRTEDACS